MRPGDHLGARTPNLNIATVCLTLISQACKEKIQYTLLFSKEIPGQLSNKQRNTLYVSLVPILPQLRSFSLMIEANNCYDDISWPNERDRILDRKLVCGDGLKYMY